MRLNRAELPYIATNGKINIISLSRQKTRYKPNKRIKGKHRRIDSEHAQPVGRNQTFPTQENAPDGTQDGNRNEIINKTESEISRAADTKK